MRSRRAILALAVFAGLVASATGGLGGGGLLCLAPALALVATLLMRRYPGERLLLRFAPSRRNRRLRPLALAPSPGRPAALMPRGGLLLAHSLAVRPPPAALLAR
jgi:hypothetical protein